MIWKMKRPIRYRPCKSFIHPDFDLSLDLPPNDIALVQVEEDLNVESSVLFAGDNAEFFGVLGHIAGWGAIEYNNAFDALYPTLLQEAAVPLVSNEVCNSPESYDGIIADSHVCAGFEEGGIDACAGDSGGPLYLDIDGIQTQVGITSFGIGCGLPNFYGIYTSVSHQIAWLNEFIDTPFQSPDLVAERMDEEAEVTGASAGDTDDDDSFLGATLAPGLWVLLGLLYCPHPRYGTRRCCAWHYINSDRISSKLVCRISRPLTRYTTYSQIFTE